MTPREMAKAILPHESKGNSYFEPDNGASPETKDLNVIMGAVVLLDVMDKAKGSVSLHRKVSDNMEKLRQAIGAFADSAPDPMAGPLGSFQTKQDEAIRKVVKFSRLLSRNVLYDPGVAFKAEAGAALDAAVLSVMLALMDAGRHVAPWDAPIRDIQVQISENRVVLEKMASVMSGHPRDDEEDDDEEV